MLIQMNGARKTEEVEANVLGFEQCVDWMDLHCSEETPGLHPPLS